MSKPRRRRLMDIEARRDIVRTRHLAQAMQLQRDPWAESRPALVPPRVIDRYVLADASSLRETERPNGLATGLALGFAIAAVMGLGAVVCYLLFRRKEPVQAAAIQPVYVTAALPPQPLVQSSSTLSGSGALNARDDADAFLEEARRRRADACR